MYQVKSARTKEKKFLPESDTHYVEFCEFNRPGRDEYNRDRTVGGAVLVDTMLRYGISDFFLPGDTGSHKYTGTDDDFIAYSDLNEELENWIIQGVARVNKLRRADGTLIAAEEDGDLGNSPSSPSEPSEESSVPTSEPETQPPPPSSTNS